MPRKKVERELRVHVVNPDAELDPRAIKRFAEWLVDFGIKVGTIPAPWERGVHRWHAKRTPGHARAAARNWSVTVI